MIDNPCVSVVITTHNRCKLLKRAIGSVLAQTYKNIELIVVNDASSDDTADYCSSAKIRCINIPLEESRGGNHARNIGIHHASGKYVAFLDDDDYWLSEKLTKQVALLEETGAGVCHCPRRNEIVNKNGDVEYYNQSLPSTFEGNLNKRILYQISIITSALVVRRNLLNEIGRFDENLKFWQEYDLSIRLAQKTDFVMVNEPLYVYRINMHDPSRLTNKYFGWTESVKYIYRKYGQLYNGLSRHEKLKYNILVTTDAIGRAQASGLGFQFMYNRLKLKFLTILESILWKNTTI